MQGTLLVRWEQEDEEAMAVWTDLPEDEMESAWDRMCFWMEDESKDHTRGEWGWQHPTMQDPTQAERLWRAMAVAMHMAVFVGGLEEAREEDQHSRSSGEAGQPQLCTHHAGANRAVWCVRGGPRRHLILPGKQARREGKTRSGRHTEATRHDGERR
jgi:hypothetical protein